MHRETRDTRPAGLVEALQAMKRGAQIERGEAKVAEAGLERLHVELRRARIELISYMTTTCLFSCARTVLIDTLISRYFLD